MNEAIRNALSYNPGKSFSDGNILVGVSETHVAVSFNNTPNNKNMLFCIELNDAMALETLLSKAISSPLQ